MRIIFFQCGCALISVTFQLSASLAIVLQFILFWLSSLLQAVLVALSLTRIFLILKVSKCQGRNSMAAFIQPTKFNQLNHERRFKLVFFGLLAGTSIYTFAVLGLLNVAGIKIVSHNHAFICCR